MESKKERGVPEDSESPPEGSGSLPEGSESLPEGSGSLPEGSGSLPEGSGSPPECSESSPGGFENGFITQKLHERVIDKPGIKTLIKQHNKPGIMKKVLPLIIVVFTSINMQAQTTGKFNFGFEFNGSNQFAKFPTGMMNGVSTFTVEFWIKTIETRSNGTYWQRSTMIGNTNPSAPDGDFGIVSSGGNLGLWHGVNSEQSVYSSTFIADNNWHHIATVCDGSNMHLFCDGILISTLSAGPAGPQTNARGWALGASDDCCVNGLGSFPHQGIYDELRISNNVRYTGNFTPPASAFTTDANTVVLLHMDVCSGSTQLTDVSGTGNNADLFNVSCTNFCDPNLGVSSIAHPVGDGIYSAGESVTATLINSGITAQSNFNVYYQIDGGAPVQETYTGTLNAGASAAYTFSTPANLSALTGHSVKVYTAVPGDCDAANDSQTNTVINQPNAAGTGKFSNGFDFNGSNQYAKFANGMMNGVNTFTVEFWIKTSETGSNGTFWQRKTMIGNENPSGNDSDFGITTDGGYLGFWHGLNGDQFATTSTFISDNNWHHIALSCDGSNNRLFADGILVGTLSAGNVLNTSSRGWCLGGSNSANFGQGVFLHSGTYDELRVSNIARYTSNFTSPASAFTSDANTVVLLHMDFCSSSTQLTDVSGTGNSADLFNVVCTNHCDPNVGVSSITHPVADGFNSATESITANLTNFGTSAQTNFGVYYQIDGGMPVQETYTGIISSGSTATYTFTTPADLSAFTSHTVKVYTSRAGDCDPYNGGLTITAISRDTTLPGYGNYRSHQSGDWNNSSTWERFNGTNWETPATPPTSANAVITIQNPHTVNFNTSAAVDQLVVSSGASLNFGSIINLNDGPGNDLEVYGSMGGCTANGPGNIVIEAGGSQTSAGSTFNTNITNNGTINYDVWCCNDFAMYVNNTFTNNGSFIMTSSGGGHQSIGGSGSFINNGIFTNNSYCYPHISPAYFTNAAGGVFNSNVYTIDFSPANGSTHAGTFNINSSYGFQFGGAGTHTYTSASVFTGSGSIYFASGTHNIYTTYNSNPTTVSGGTANFNQAGDISFSSLTITGGTLGGTATKTLPDGTLWSGGTISGADVTIPSSATITLGGGFNGGVALNATLTNNGTINWFNSNVGSSLPLVFSTTINGSLINNGTFISDATSDLSQSHEISMPGTGSFINNGTYTRTARTPGILYIGVANITNTGSINILGGTVHFTNNCTLSGTITVGSTLSANLLTFTGSSITNNGSIVAAQLIFGGSSLQQLNGTGNINYLSVDNTTGVSVGGNQTINNTLNFAAGKLSLGSNDLTMAPAAAITGAGSAGYIIANSTGGLIRRVNASASVQYPLGTANTYCPVILSATANHVSHDIKARLADALYDSYDASGNPTGVSIPSLVVNRTWLLSDATAGTNDLDIIFQWTGADESIGYSHSRNRSAAYVNGNWILGNTSSPSGPNPYSFTRHGVTTLSPFGFINGFITCTGNLGPFCTSSSFNLNYATVGEVDAGIETFTAQLSNASGSFASPSNIGSAMAEDGGTIGCTIPANAVAGTGYRVRIKSSYPDFISADNGSNITINSSPTAFLVGPPSSVYCPNTSGNLVALQSSQIGVNYQLFRNVNPVGSFIPGTGAQLNFPNQTAIGVYSIVATGTVSPFCSRTMTNSATIIEDAIIPVINSCAPNKNVNTDAGQCTASNVLLGTPDVTDNCGIASMTNDAPSVFPIGTTDIHWAINDYSGNTSYCGQQVTVTDSEQPTITCSSDLSFNVTSSCEKTGVTLILPTVSDNCGVNSPIADYTSTTFPVGVTNVTWTATDVNGNFNSCVQHITVNDIAPPSITCAADVTVNTDAGHNYATLSGLTAPVTSDVCGVIPAVNNHPSSVFPLGTTDVIWTGSDIHNNTATCTQQVTVQDHEAPVFSNIPSDISQCNTHPTWTPPTATDNCGSVTITSTHNPGATFPIGTTPVTYTATDASGNTATASFDVIIGSAFTPTITAGGATDLCPGNNVTLTSSVADSYLWSTGETTQSIDVVNANAYKVTCTINGCPGISAPTAVSVYSSVLPFKTQWQTSFGGTGQDKAYSIQQTSDGGYIVAGTSYNSINNSSDARVYKLNSNGNQEWLMNYDGLDDDEANAVQQTSDGGYIVAGYTTNTGTHQDFMMWKLSSLGAVEWQQNFGGTFTEIANAVQQTTDGIYFGRRQLF